MERITIYPDKELKEKVEAGAKKENRSINNFIIWLIKKYFKKSK